MTTHRDWFGSPEYYYCEAVEKYVVHAWSKEDENGRGYGLVVEIAHFESEDHARNFVWDLEHPGASDAIARLVNACESAIKGLQFPVGTIKIKEELDAALADARRGVGVLVGANKSHRTYCAQCGGEWVIAKRD